MSSIIQHLKICVQVCFSKMTHQNRRDGVSGCLRFTGLANSLIRFAYKKCTEGILRPEQDFEKRNRTKYKPSASSPKYQTREEFTEVEQDYSTAPKSSTGTVNPNLPPLRFHNVHGDNVRLYKNGFVAKRVESFCKGVAFSCRPVAINERVYVKFLEISDNWSGVLRFGFTSEDPLNIKKVPKYACPDLTSKSGFWAKALSERHANNDAVLFFYVDAGGDVHYGLNGESKGVFMQGIDTRSPLWVLMDIYGNSTIVEFLDCRPQLNNNRRSIEDSSDLNSQMSTMTISPPAVRRVPFSEHLEPVELARKGRHVMISMKDGVPCVGTRLSTAFFQGYTFTKRPLVIGEKYVVQITKTSQLYVGSLSFGVTCCDPNTIGIGELPDDPNQLVDRREYWVMSRNVAEETKPGDILVFSINHNGEVLCAKNGGLEVVLMCVDHSQTLWGVFDIYGTTTQIVVSKIPLPPNSNGGCMQNIITQSSLQPSTSYEPVSSSPQQNHQALCYASPPPPIVRSNILEVNTDANGGTVLIVNLPAAQSSQVCHPSPALSQVSSIQSTVRPPSVTIQQVQPRLSPPPQQVHIPEPLPSGEGECSICFERNVDCALYTCGHLCMCYECAKKQWVRLGRCPICRAVIKDVIKIYK
ncbi:protein neuralized isoform X2 [Daktulosphaira vitifoliae]|uniref:protein neuralized isoform X2 n=1 Tax=Daktulosphaira vitifoliae TaxID=58002 RepID=UPI0021A9809F|nr:protein neuralized isoform X2 [Daktulosphaira vitifoliae]